jgi:TetR/AcrR family transcriptional repressor of nem operon
MARPREFDEPTVIAAARDVFWAHGYAGTSVDAIGAATGLGKGSLYGAFGGKREIFHRVFDQYCADAVEAAALALTGPDQGAVERLRQYVAPGASASGGNVQRGCLIAKGVAELAEHDADVAQRARETYASIESYLTTTIEAAQRHGELNAQGDARALAQTLLALQRGIEALAKAGTPVLAPAIVDTALTSFR